MVAKKHEVNVVFYLIWDIFDEFIVSIDANDKGMFESGLQGRKSWGGVAIAKSGMLVFSFIFQNF